MSEDTNVSTVPEDGAAADATEATSPDVTLSDAASPDVTSPETTTLDTGTEVTFASLDLPAPLIEVLNEAGVVTAFPIQAATIPDALIGRDVLGRGRTGSGKTLAFGLPTLARLEGLRAKPRRPLALVLVPTRELAMQVEDALRPYARALRLRIRSVYGGAPMRKQIDSLRYGVELLVATPGRLSDLIERGECELNEVDVAILDEADQMCDMGFLPHVCELMDQVAADGQRLLFSATLDGAVDEIVKKYMNDPVLHEVDPQAGVVSTMSHHLLMVAPQHKAKVAAQIAARHSAESGNTDGRSIFFVRTQLAVERVTEQFRDHGLPAAGLHGGMTQVARTKTLEDFKEGRTPVLIATDVAARGIHVDGIDLVVHLDPARDSKDYLHRAGRTARAGQTGVVASLILPKQRKQAQRLMDDAGVTAEEIDAAPLGVGGRWEPASAALAQLTGAREVPEPGEVTPFTLPVRERVFRSNERRDGDRYGRDDRRGGFGGSGSRFGGRDFGGNGFARRDGERYGRDERRGPSADRGFGNRGFAGRDFERRDFGAATAAETPVTPEHAGDTGGGNIPSQRQGETQSQSAGRFERRDGDRFGRDDRRRPSFERRDGDRYGRDGHDRDRSQDRGGWRGGASTAGRGSTERGFGDRGFGDRGFGDRGFGGRSGDGRGAERRGFERGGFDSSSSESRGFKDRGTDNRGTDNRGTANREFGGREAGGRGFKDRGFKDRGFKERSFDGRGSFERNDRTRSADRPSFGDRATHTDRPARTDRAPYGDRPARSDRAPYGDRPARSDRAPYGDRPARSDRAPYGDRPAYGERPKHGDRFGRDDRRGTGTASRPRPDWDRSGKPQHSSREGKPRP